MKNENKQMGILPRLWRATSRTVLFFAFLHVAILIIYATASGDINILNIFSILQVQLFFDLSLEQDASNILSAMIMTGVYVVMYILR